MINKIIFSLALLIFSNFSFADNAASEAQSKIQNCSMYVNEYAAVVSGQLKMPSSNAAKQCISDSIKKSPQYLFVSIFINQVGADVALEWATENKLAENFSSNTPEMPKNGTFIEKILFYVFWFSLLTLGISIARGILDYLKTDKASLTGSFKTTAQAFVIMVLLIPFGTQSIFAIALGWFFGMLIYVLYLCVFLVTPIFTSVFMPSDIEHDYSKETIETSKSLVAEDLLNLLKIKTAEFNLKSADVAYNIETDITGKILADSVQNTLDCYSINSDPYYENGKLRLPKSAQNARCYAALTNNAYFQNFGSISVDYKDRSKTAFWIDKENDIEALQEEERRYACVIRLSSLNKEAKNLDCIDYRNNEVVREGIYAKMITESLSYEELESRKLALIESRYQDVNTQVKTETAITYEEVARKQLPVIINGGIASLYFAYAKAAEFSLKPDTYIDYFRNNKITFNGYAESKSNSELFLSGKSSANVQSLLVPIEKPEFYVVSNSNPYKQSSYIDNLIPSSTFNCKNGISNCSGIKEVNIVDIEKKAAMLFSGVSKTYFVLNETKKAFSINNQILSIVTMVLGFIMKLTLTVVACTTYLMFLILSLKSFSLFAFLILISFDFIVVLIRYLASLGWNTKTNAAHQIKELMFNAVIEPVLFVAAYVFCFWCSISVVSLAIYTLNLEFTNVMQTLVTLRIDSITNLCILLVCLVIIAIAPGFIAKWAVKYTLKGLNVRPLDEIDNEIEGFYGEGKNYASKFMRKLVG
ncbi:hypothetical protein [Pseudomonas paracarnis]|uniref:hypothetical protein n=2 Tax=Pseudomonas TaxID=286 RepID=UPI0015E3B711|nr:hypothetical protein [Pseudomonas paracarnis]MBW9245425.1 hypothetical protein [Pseudomonas paracarnis]